jgi:rhodanese-related sulfurtransferase
MISFWVILFAASLAGFLIITKIFSRNANLRGAIAMEIIKNGATVVDVRTASEFEYGHFEGAINIPLQGLHSRLPELGNKNTPIVVYCATGMRSANAAKILTDAGYTDVTDAGGLDNLK